MEQFNINPKNTLPQRGVRICLISCLLGIVAACLRLPAHRMSPERPTLPSNPTVTLSHALVLPRLIVTAPSSASSTIPLNSSMRKLTPSIQQTVRTQPPTITMTKPTYVFPVRAAHLSYDASHHDYPAVDIFCAIGSEFVAPTSGVVDFINTTDRWNPATDYPADRGGLAVAIIGNDGLRYYGSHLSAITAHIQPGTHVVAGQILGLTGKSGNAVRTAPHLHFGISRPTTADDWQTRRGEIPPYRYLKAWQNGDHITPQLPIKAP